MRGIRRYAAIAYVGLVVLWVRLLLRVSSLPKVLEAITPESTKSPRSFWNAGDLAYLTDRWLTLFPYNVKGNCYPRSLVLYRFAKLAGDPVHFHCGIRKLNGNLDGHAWLTLDGQPYHEPTLHWRTFIVTFTFPSLKSAGTAEKSVASPLVREVAS
jgi:hypothetical protein